jgi:hypothetical protein
MCEAESELVDRGDMFARILGLDDASGNGGYPSWYDVLRTESLDQVIQMMLNNSATSDSLFNTELSAADLLWFIATMTCREYANRQRIGNPNSAQISLKT